MKGRHIMGRAGATSGWIHAGGRPGGTMFRMVILPLALAVGCHHEEKHAVDSPTPPVVDGDRITFAANAPQLGYLTIESVQKRNTRIVSLGGRLAWNDDATVRVFSPVAGHVERFGAELNQSVRKGDVLAWLSSPDYGQAQSDAAKAESDRVLAERTLARFRELLGHGAVARKDVEQAEADAAKACVESDRARAQLLGLSFGRTNGTPGLYELCSPLDGVVVERNLSPGQQVRPDQMLANAPQYMAPLLIVSDPSRLWLFLDVAEQDVAWLKPGQDVSIHLHGAPDRVFGSRVEMIGQGLDDATRTVPVRCVVNNADNGLRAGMYVTADVEVPVAPGVDIPAGAFFLNGSQACVFVESGPGRFQRRAVLLGDESNGRSTVISGLAPGDRVVTDGGLLLEAMLEGDAP